VSKPYYTLLNFTHITKTYTSLLLTALIYETKEECLDDTNEECLAATVAPKTEGKPLVLLQVNCRSIYNKTLDFWNLTDTHNPDVAIGTESWLSKEIIDAEVFRADCKTFRTDRHTHCGGVFVCVKYCITCAEPWVDEVHEMISVEVKGSDLKLHGKLLASTELQVCPVAQSV